MLDTIDMICSEQSSEKDWEAFLQAQPYSPFLQSTCMQRIYKQVGQSTKKVSVVTAEGVIKAICLVVIVRARRGHHLSIPYGPVIDEHCSNADKKIVLDVLLHYLKNVGVELQCRFIRFSPFWPINSDNHSHAQQSNQSMVLAPLHLLSEYTWYLPLTTENQWTNSVTEMRTKDDVFKNLRKTTRNLVRRAEKEGVTIVRSNDPNGDLPLFLQLHEATRQRHKFTPYTDSFFTAQVEQMAASNMCSLYLAYYQEQCISASIHVHYGKETSYHHGASASQFSKIPASYLLQWRAICDAIDRQDAIYNFWGIAPVTQDEKGKWHTADKHHPFAGVTTFKTGFGGKVLPLMHCTDIPLHWKYYATRWFEIIRKWKRGF